MAGSAKSDRWNLVPPPGAVRLSVSETPFTVSDAFSTSTPRKPNCPSPSTLPTRRMLLSETVGSSMKKPSASL